jgi:hypothetical protein
MLRNGSEQGTQANIKVNNPSPEDSINSKVSIDHLSYINHHQLFYSKIYPINMKTAFSIAALAGAASAQIYNITSKPFQILLTSADGSINDTVSACHTGAALESLCLSNSNSTSKPNPTPYSTFNFNTTSTAEAPVNHTELGVPGILTWFLPAGNYGPVPSAAQFFYDATTDIAVPILETGSSGQLLAFDDKDELLVQGYVQWTANPPTYGEIYGLKRWYACTTYFEGYQYENLVWGLGEGKPEDPTCVAVDVKRVFV